jgi:hypothetical protein
VSTEISRPENYFSVQLPVVDSVGVTLLRRVKDLLATRADMSRLEFGQFIKRPTPSWVSEFFAGKRTTNDLRLVIRMARVLRVPVSHLLNEADDAPDARTLSLMGAWKALDEKQQKAVLRLALDLRGDADTEPPGSSGPSSAGPEEDSDTDDSRAKTRRRTRR